MSDTEKVYEIWAGNYLPAGFFDPGYFDETEMVEWPWNKELAFSRCDDLVMYAEFAEEGYVVIETDEYNPTFHTDDLKITPNTKEDTTS